MFLISDYLKKLTLVTSDNGFELLEYRPTLLHPLLVPFEKLSFARKTRLRLELIRGVYIVYYLAVDGAVVGYNVIAPGGRRLKLSTPKDIVVGPLFISPEHRGKGYSVLLMKLPLMHCSYEYERAFDWIAKSNIPSIKASLSCGFKECGRLNVNGVFRRLVEDEDGDEIIFCYTKESEKDTVQ